MKRWIGWASLLSGLLACGPSSAGGGSETAASSESSEASESSASESEGETSGDEALDPKVVKAAELANKIDADPDNADQILADAGMDREAFNALIYEVSTPTLAEQYRLARARAAG